MRGRLWRKSNRSLNDEARAPLVLELKSARRAVRDTKDDPLALQAARKRVDEAKFALGERGPV